MKCRLSAIVLLAGVYILTAGTAHAMNITINDGRAGVDSWHGANSGANSNVSFAREDNEVEPGMQIGQKWDLERFSLDGNVLSMVGGYNFKDGETGNNILFTSGDIFINSDSDAAYDYAIDLDFSGTQYKYTVYGIDSTTKLLLAYYNQNSASNPWAIGADGKHTLVDKGDLIYTPGLPDFDGLTGGTHNVVSGLDLSFLGSGKGFTAHFTMQCGNDNLMGRGTTAVPEPGTLLLLGAGLVGLAGLRRRKRV